MNPPAVATAAAPSADVDRLNFIWSIQESLLKLHLTKTQVLPVNSGAEWTNALHILAKTGDPVARQTVCERLSQVRTSIVLLNCLFYYFLWKASGVIRTSRFLSDCERITESIMVSKHRLPAHGNYKKTILIVVLIHLIRLSCSARTAFGAIARQCHDY